MRWLPVIAWGLVACSGEGAGAGAGAGASAEASASAGAGASAEASASAEAGGGAAGPGPAHLACEEVDFADSVDLPEASGAVWVEPSFGLPAHVVAVGDSRNRGAFAVIDADTGALLARGTLPLDPGASDDLEGLARTGDRYHAINSGGWVRTFRRTGAARFERLDAYPLHPEMLCSSPKRTNCGMDFEGLCLAAPGPGCDGFAASKARGELVCLELDPRGRLTAAPEGTLKVAPRAVLSGCAITPEGDRLLAGMNLLGGNSVVAVSPWRDPASARLEPLGPLGAGNAEAIAAGPGGAIVRLSDTAAAISAARKVSCRAGGR